MRVPETAGILEPVAERTVEADVRKPNQGDLHGCSRSPQEPADPQRDRKRIRVHDVVADSSDSRAGYVPDNPQIWRQEQHDQEDSPVAGVKVEREGADEDRESFEPQEPCGEASGHGGAHFRFARKHSVT